MMTAGQDRKGQPASDSDVILLIDMGNSRIKWATATAGRIGELMTMATDTAAFTRFQALQTVPRRVLATSVTGRRLRAALSGWCQAHWGLQPEFAFSERERLGLRNAYRDHRLLGVDRWLAMLAAWSRTRAACCVVDAGTALTVDLVDAGGQHLGGYIVPGAQLMAAALERRTADIARHSRAAPATFDVEARPGRNTAAAVAAGSRQALAGLVDRAMARLGGGARLYLSGGEAAALQPLLPSAEHCPSLVLEGLLLQFEQARCQPSGDA